MRLAACGLPARAKDKEEPSLRRHAQQGVDHGEVLAPRGMPWWYPYDARLRQRVRTQLEQHVLGKPVNHTTAGVHDDVATAAHGAHLPLAQLPCTGVRHLRLVAPAVVVEGEAPEEHTTGETLAAGVDHDHQAAEVGHRRQRRRGVCAVAFVMGGVTGVVIKTATSR